MMKKAQSAVEFIILMGVVSMMFVIFVSIIQGNISDEVKDNRDTVLKEVALTVQNEISLAINAPDGYLREFTLPPNILGLDYEINLTGTSVFIRTLDSKHAIALPAQNVTDAVNPGVNIIRKINGTVSING